MTYTEKWEKITQLQAEIRAVDERRTELCRELNKTIMIHTPAEPRRKSPGRDNKPTPQPGRTFA
jgi:hypothetical protein